MSVREVKEIEFSNIADCNAWISYQRNFNDAFRLCGTNVLNNGQTIAQYIELF